MKIIFPIIIIAICILNISVLQAQVVSIPNRSEKHLAKKYPGSTEANWTNNVASYTCKFKWEGREYKAYYRMDGTWDFTMKYMTESELPQAVKTSVSTSRIADWKPKTCAFIENHKGKKSYRVEREKGVENKYIFYDRNGKELKSTVKL